ncbi:peptidoglycan-binding protein [Streptosporangiaceae bacterium NEAU-GS5]|nr:peptidoglycan-binding protein [Streptosporangiaceae bacterium NEAU-GS5]
MYARPRRRHARPEIRRRPGDDGRAARKSRLRGHQKGRRGLPEIVAGRAGRAPVKRGAVIVGAAVVAIGGGAAAAAFTGGGAAPAPTATPSATAEITRSDLVDTKDVDGTLGYSGRRVLPNQAQGTVTRIRDEGAVVRRGGWLYQVAGRPVILMYGNIPIYRRLAYGVEGKDVEQLERNLEALGYDPGTVDENFSGLTAKAVRDWQDDNNLPETGAVDSAQVIVGSGPLRIAEATAEKGDPAGRSVVTTTSTKRIVHVDLPASDQQLARLGARCGLELPTGTTTTGTITAIGTVAQPAKQQGGEATIDLEVTVKGRLGRLDQAPITVSLQSERHKNVLSVPVEALLALREGGYGIRLAGGQVIPVTPGLFAAGRVEISTPTDAPLTPSLTLTPGQKVEVPPS